MKRPQLGALLSWHSVNKLSRLQGRRIVLEDIQDTLMGLKDMLQVEIAGASYRGQPILKVSLGQGPTKVLMWTQMHGDESTGTKAFMDLMHFFNSPGEFKDLARYILDRCTIICLPILNPDGAASYTRINAQDIDLNRDVLDQKAPESVILQKVLKQADPAYCFNLHDQRNIFSVGTDPKPATISFLAPSEDLERSLTEGRKKTMRAIVAMHDFLKSGLPGQMGRYTDEFYPTATGDNFQRLGYSTILIESGHYPGDLDREMARKFTFAALIEGMRYIATGKEEAEFKDYFEIPDNDKNYLDVIVENVVVNGQKKSLGVLLKAHWDGSNLRFIPQLEACGELGSYGADRIEDGKGRVFESRINAEKWVQDAFN